MYQKFDHGADIGIRGIGINLEEAFSECAKAMFDVMVDIKSVKPSKKIKINVQAENIKELLVEFLNNLLAQSDLNDMVFSQFKVEIKDGKLSALAFGEKLNPQKHNIKTEVKAATYSMLKIEKKDDKYIVQCIIDV